MILPSLKNINLFNLILRERVIRCYPFCLDLNYDRKLGITQAQWETSDVNVIAEVLLKDLRRLKLSCKIVDKTYVPSANEKLLALKVGIMWVHGDYLHYVDYHIIVKRQDGHWYSKFGDLPPEQLPLGTDIELWNWRDSDGEVPENHYNSEIVYVAVKC